MADKPSCLRAESGQTRQNVNQRMISVVHASAPGILQEEPGVDAGWVGRQDGLSFSFQHRSEATVGIGLIFPPLRLKYA